MSGKVQAKKVNPYDTKHVRRALDNIIREGAVELTQTEGMLKDHVDALVSALVRTISTPEIEVRLTYKTTAQATAAWTWLTVAVQHLDFLDIERCSAFDVELKNGSGIMFWTEEAVKDVEKVGNG